MLEALKRFLSGVCRLTPETLMAVKPRESLKLHLPDTANHHLLESAYRLLWSKKATYSLEMRKESEIMCFASAEKRSSLEELVKRLVAVHPFPRFEPADIPLPEECYVSAGYLKLSGTPYMLKTEADPLIHALSAADSILIQFLFRPERIVVEKFHYESPVFKLRVAVAAFAESREKALNTCRRVLESFTLLSSAHTSLEPVLPRIPNSCALLKSMLERRFLLGDSFRVTAEELAALAHLPGGLLDPRVYRKGEAGNLRD